MEVGFVKWKDFCNELHEQLQAGAHEHLTFGVPTMAPSMPATKLPLDMHTLRQLTIEPSLLTSFNTVGPYIYLPFCPISIHIC